MTFLIMLTILWALSLIDALLTLVWEMAFVTVKFNNFDNSGVTSYREIRKYPNQA